MDQTLVPSVPLSPVESFFWRFEEDLDGAFRVTVLMRLAGWMEAAFLETALAHLQSRHPKLRALITMGSDGRLEYQFDSTPPLIPYEILDCDDAETPWRETTRRLMQVDLSPGRSLAAVTVLRNRFRNTSDLFFSLPHAIADGMSGIMLVNDLLVEYARAERQSDSTPNPVLPVVTALRALSPKGWRGQLRVLRRFIRLQRQQSRTPLTSLPVAPDVTPHSQWVHWVFTPEETLALIKRCRKEKTSLTGVLVAAACCALRDCLSSPEVCFRWQVPFNLREHLKGSAGPVTPQDLGCFVSNMNGLVVMTEPLPFWDMARRAHQDLQTFVEEGGPSFGYNAASVLYSLRARILWLFTRRPIMLKPSTAPRDTVLATNYGVLNMSDSYGSLRPEACTLMFKNEITGPALVLEALVLINRLNIGFAADDLEPSFWEQLCPSVKSYLDAAIEGGPQPTPQRISVAPQE